MKSFSSIRVAFVFVGVAAAVTGCSWGHHPLDDYVHGQKEKVTSKSIYNGADLDFWAASYDPTFEDVQGLKRAWIEHGEAFPESEPLKSLERELQKGNQEVFLIGIFTTYYELGDLRNKSLGWAISPVPDSIDEYPATDVPLRALMPIRNDWARYFLVHYRHGQADFSKLVISNRTSRMELPLKR